MASIRLLDTTVYYRLDGRERATPLVLSHGFTVNHHMWAWQREPFSRHYRVLTWDAPGHGRTVADKPRRRTSIRFMARLLAALMDRLGMARAHVGGLSMGGMVALQLALDFPRRVNALLLMDTTAGRLDWHYNLFLAAIGMSGVLPFPDDGLVPHAYRSMFDAAPSSARSYPQIKELRAHLGRHLDERAMLRTAFDIVFKRSVKKRLDEITRPTLVVDGTLDPLYQHNLALAEGIRGSELVVLERCGHGSALLRPVAFNAAVLDFLRRVDQGKRTGGTFWIPKGRFSREKVPRTLAELRRIQPPSLSPMALLRIVRNVRRVSRSDDPS